MKCGCLDAVHDISQFESLMVTTPPIPGRYPVSSSRWGNRISSSVRVTVNEILFPHLLELTGYLPGMGGVVTIKDSNWLMSWTASKQPHFINQPDNVRVLWAYG